MDETRLRTIEQLEEFLSACGPVAFTAEGDDGERYAHISRVLLRFDYPSGSGASCCATCSTPAAPAGRR